MYTKDYLNVLVWTKTRKHIIILLINFFSINNINSEIIGFHVDNSLKEKHKKIIKYRFIEGKKKSEIMLMLYYRMEGFC